MLPRLLMASRSSSLWRLVLGFPLREGTIDRTMPLDTRRHKPFQLRPRDTRNRAGKRRILLRRKQNSHILALAFDVYRAVCGSGHSSIEIGHGLLDSQSHRSAPAGLWSVHQQPVPKSRYVMYSLSRTAPPNLPPGLMGDAFISRPVHGWRVIGGRRPYERIVPCTPELIATTSRCSRQR